jgi:hypothetical protein
MLEHRASQVAAIKALPPSALDELHGYITTITGQILRFFDILRLFYERVKAIPLNSRIIEASSFKPSFFV